MPKRKALDQKRVDDLVARTEGVCRRRDLERAGIPPSTVSFRLRPSGRWRRMFAGVILTSSGVPTQRQLLLGALLYAGGGGMLSGHTALVLYGVRAAKPSEPIQCAHPAWTASASGARTHDGADQTRARASFENWPALRSG